MSLTLAPFGFYINLTPNPKRQRMVSMMGSFSTEGTPTWRFPFSHTEWDQTPDAVQAHVLTLHTQLYELQQQHHQLQQQVDTLQGRLDKTSQTSRKPPSSDSPFTKPTRRPSSGKRGARKGHLGSGVTLLAPTDVQHGYPAPCACDHSALGIPTPYHTHQVIELPPIEMAITHFLLPQAHWEGCGALLKAAIPSEHTTGYAGPFSFRKEVAKQAQNECKGCVPCGASLPRHAPMTQNPCMQTTSHDTTAPSTPRGLL